MMKISKILLLLFAFTAVLSCNRQEITVKDDPELNNRLLEAVKDKDLQAAEKLLRKGADPNTLMDSATTVLHLAIYKNDTEMTKLLLEYGSDSQRQDSDRIVPLTLAAMKGNPEITKMLIADGADVNHINNNIYKTTALMEAANVNAADVVNILLAHGADTEIEDVYFGTAVYFATNSGSFDSLYALVDGGADPGYRHPASNVNALDLALVGEHADGQYEKVISYMKRLGVEPTN